MLGEVQERFCIVDTYVKTEKIIVRLSYDDCIEAGLTARQCIDGVLAIMESR
tara:strand:+ start:281 stop:436 length:156 start_codon:yes stop_codon:yes gene_type:complete